MSFDDMPPELVLHICSHCSHRDLARLCLLTKTYHRYITSALYYSVILDFEYPNSLRRANAVIVVLADRTRDEASFVREFFFTAPRLIQHAPQWMGLLFESIANMVNLRRFGSRRSFAGFLPGAILSLSRLSTLTSLQIGDSFIPKFEEWDLSALQTARPLFPDLVKLELSFEIKLPPLYRQFLTYLLQAHSQTLRVFVFMVHDLGTMTLNDLLPEDVVFPRLDSLTLLERCCELQLLHHVPVLSHIQASSKLYLHELPPIESIYPLSSYPIGALSVRRISCTPLSLQRLAVLAPHVETVDMTPVPRTSSYELDSFLRAFSTVTDTNFRIRNFVLRNVAFDIETIPPFISCFYTLENVVIRAVRLEETSFERMDSIMSLLFRKATRLESFYMVSPASSWWECLLPDETARHSMLMKWQSLCPTLKTVLFDTEIWERQPVDSGDPESQFEDHWVITTTADDPAAYPPWVETPRYGYTRR